MKISTKWGMGQDDVERSLWEGPLELNIAKRRVFSYFEQRFPEDGGL
jgi:hypothetical protein